MIDIRVRLGDGRMVGHIAIHCIEARGRQPDSVNVYEAVIEDANPNKRRTRIVTIEHRYGDHWTVLLRKVLEAAEIHTTH